MFKITLGSILLLLSPLAQVFFNHYRGTHIHHTFLLYILSILLIPLGLILVYNGAQDKLDKKKAMDMKALQPLKEHGQKIIVSYDNCRFITNNYEVTNIVAPPVTINGSGGLGETVEMEDIQQSVVTYRYKNGDQTEEFQSQVFPISVIALEAHVIKNELILYVDRKNRKNYYFDLPDPNIQPYTV